MGMTYTHDTSKTDPVFEEFMAMGIIKDEMDGIPVTCDLCSHKFDSVFVNEEVKCPNCKSYTYVESI